MADLPRRGAFLLGLGTAAAGPLTVGANITAAAAAFGPGYAWRYYAWGQKENTRNDAYFPRRAVPAGGAAAPLPQAIDERRMERALDRGPLQPFLEGTQTTALLVAQDGKLLLEAYANGGARAARLGSRSMAKSVLGLLTGIAIAEGRIPSVEAPLETLLPDAPGLRGSGVTLRHAMQMGDGLDYRGDGAPLGAFTDRGLWDGYNVAYFVPRLRAYLGTARRGRAPGTRFHYDDRSAQMVGWALYRAFGAPLSEVLSTRIWQPIGAEASAEWSLNSVADGMEKAEGGLFATARDWLRLGTMVLQDGAGVVPAQWMTELEAPAAPIPADYYAGQAEIARFPEQYYAKLWWAFARPDGPAELFMHGLYGQVVYVSRARRAVAVRLGVDYGGITHWPDLLRGLVNRL